MGFLLVMACMMFFSVGFPGNAGAQAGLTLKQQLGKALFFDRTLSNPPGQSCGDCHLPGMGFTDPDKALPVSEGVIAGRFGNRSAPAAAYAGFSPVFRAAKMQGGQFWDGRARNLKEQAKAPFLNPLEMHNTVAGVVATFKANPEYGTLFNAIYPGLSILANDQVIYDKIAGALAAYQMSGEVCQFTSKFDAFWRACKAAGIENPAALTGPTNPVGVLSDAEFNGFLVFKGKGKCINCHTLSNTVRNPAPPAARVELMPVFSDFKYHNLGIPRNENNPWYDMPAEFNPGGEAFQDLGLAMNPAYRPGTARYEAAKGRFKTPTLRNIALTAPYGHNGVFTDPRGTFFSLMMITHFYATRDVPGEGWPPAMLPPPPGMTSVPWPPPEVMQNVNTQDMGQLGLTPQEGMALVNFFMTLTDGFTSP